MKATVKRHARGWYHIIFKAPSHIFGVVGFKLIGDNNQWQLFNHFNTELNCCTTKKSMVEYLEDKTETQLLELNNRR